MFTYCWRVVFQFLVHDMTNTGTRRMNNTTADLVDGERAAIGLARRAASASRACEFS